MKNKIVLILILFAFKVSFGQNKTAIPEVNPTEIQKKFSVWEKYQTENIMLSADYISLDTNSKKITKEQFLNKLTLGKWIPIRLKSKDTLTYKLFAINKTSDSSIKATIGQIAFDEYKNFKTEGVVFPAFSFTDLNGNLVTNESMKGKIVVIKCWYIHCALCIKEFPDVNNLVEKYKDRKDILFISLAEDTPEQLNNFLQKKTLLYSVIPNMKTYMNESLNLNTFPTHFIINKNGIISKVLNNFESLEVALEKESKL